MTNRVLLCLNRSSMSCTVKWAPPSSFVRSAPRTTKTSRSNPAVTSCALPVLRPGRYYNEPRCIKSFRDQNFEQRGTSAALADCCCIYTLNSRICTSSYHYLQKNTKTSHLNKIWTLWIFWVDNTGFFRLMCGNESGLKINKLLHLSQKRLLNNRSSFSARHMEKLPPSLPPCVLASVLIKFPHIS